MILLPRFQLAIWTISQPSAGLTGWGKARRAGCCRRALTSNKAAHVPHGPVPSSHIELAGLTGRVHHAPAAGCNWQASGLAPRSRCGPQGAGPIWLIDRDQAEREQRAADDNQHAKRSPKQPPAEKSESQARQRDERRNRVLHQGKTAKEERRQPFGWYRVPAGISTTPHGWAILSRALGCPLSLGTRARATVRCECGKHYAPAHDGWPSTPGAHIRNRIGSREHWGLEHSAVSCSPSSGNT